MDYTALIISKQTGEEFSGKDLVDGFYVDTFTYSNTDPLIVELKAAKTAVNDALENGDIVEITGEIICYCEPWMTHWVNVFSGRRFRRV